ncbi:protein PRRC2A-like [Ovis canadensis]|uniref:protein PRRC2A-like n=1 Tax=Ovis canadensis TaxID=37174 RepID=UPI0037538918
MCNNCMNPWNKSFPIKLQAILMIKKGNDNGAFFLHCLGGPARTGHPGRCRARCSAHLRTQPYSTSGPRRRPRGRRSSITRPDSPRKWRGRQGRRPPGPSLRSRGQSKKSPEKAPRPRQTSSLQSYCPRPRTSGGQGATRPKSGAPRRHEGRGRAPRLRDGAGRPVGFRSLRLIRQNTTRQTRSATHPPARRTVPDRRSLAPKRPFAPPAARHATTNLQPQPSSRAARDREGRRRAGRGRRGSRVRGPHHGLQRAGGTAWTPQPRSLVQHPGNGGLGGVCRPGEGARRGGWAAAAAPIGPGSRPSARAPAPSRDAPPRLVQRRPEGSSALPVFEMSQPAGCSYLRGTRDPGRALDSCCRPQGRRPPSLTQTPTTPGSERLLGLGGRGPSCEEGWLGSDRGALAPLRPPGERWAGSRKLFFPPAPSCPLCWSIRRGRSLQGDQTSQS